MRNPYIDAAGLCTAAANDDEPPVSRLDRNMRPSLCLGIGIPLGLFLWLLIGTVLLAAVS